MATMINIVLNKDSKIKLDALDLITDLTMNEKLNTQNYYSYSSHVL